MINSHMEQWDNKKEVFEYKVKEHGDGVEHLIVKLSIPQYIQARLNLTMRVEINKTREINFVVIIGHNTH